MQRDVLLLGEMIDAAEQIQVLVRGKMQSPTMAADVTSVPRPRMIIS